MILRTLNGAAAGQVSFSCFPHVDALSEHTVLDLRSVQASVYRS